MHAGVNVNKLLTSKMATLKTENLPPFPVSRRQIENTAIFVPPAM